MKKPENPLDAFFREALKDHSMVPTEAARKAFLHDAAQMNRTGNNHRKGLIIAVVMVLLALSGIGTWVMVDSGEKSGMKEGLRPISEKTAPTHPTQNVDSEKDTYKKSRNTQIAAMGSATTFSSKESQAPPASSNQTYHVDSVNTYSEKEEPAVTFSPAEPSPTANTGETSITTERSDIENNLRINDETTSDLLLPSTSISDDSTVSHNKTSLPIPQEGEQKGSANSSGQRRHNAMVPAFGVQYTPEIMFNNLEGEKIVHNFGVEGVFQFGPFSIRTGAGLSLATGTNEVRIEYNEYLGTFNKLDSMDFTWDNSIYKYLPTYYLSKQDVYDSLLQYDNHRIEKRYSYLRIPLIFGYTMVENRRWSLGVRTGPVMSVLLGTKQLSGNYDEGKNHIVHINDITPEQVSLNWQAMAGVNVGLRLDERFRFELEPSVSYYFNSVFEKPGTSVKPYSAGIRAAFLIQL